MTGHAAFNASALGWTGLAVGLAGLAAYVVVILRQPEVVRMLNGSGLMLTSLALTQSCPMIGSVEGSTAFPVQAAVVLLIMAVVAQAAAGLRNRRAWDGVERRRPDIGVWDSEGVRSRAAGEAGVRSRPVGEERA
ncbi:hypothetical protein [Caulobacter sp. S45]|uniref:hypothetical protein n=1 Tax=Caulobacter sp. S45 TaxID=1641861 RepID=UPI0015774F68|nr:hypothetical protein [Caulobacter sp. S45]